MQGKAFYLSHQNKNERTALCHNQFQNSFYPSHRIREDSNVLPIINRKKSSDSSSLKGTRISEDINGIKNIGIEVGWVGEYAQQSYDGENRVKVYDDQFQENDKTCVQSYIEDNSERYKHIQTHSYETDEDHQMKEAPQSYYSLQQRKNSQVKQSFPVYQTVDSIKNGHTSIQREQINQNKLEIPAQLSPSQTGFHYFGVQRNNGSRNRQDNIEFKSEQQVYLRQFENKELQQKQSIPLNEFKYSYPQIQIKQNEKSKVSMNHLEKSLNLKEMEQRCEELQIKLMTSLSSLKILFRDYFAASKESTECLDGINRQIAKRLKMIDSIQNEFHISLKDKIKIETTQRQQIERNLEMVQMNQAFDEGNIEYGNTQEVDNIPRTDPAENNNGIFQKRVNQSEIPQSIVRNDIKRINSITGANQHFYDDIYKMQEMQPPVYQQKLPKASSQQLDSRSNLYKTNLDLAPSFKVNKNQILNSLEQNVNQPIQRLIQPQEDENSQALDYHNSISCSFNSISPGNFNIPYRNNLPDTLNGSLQNKYQDNSNVCIQSNYQEPLNILLKGSLKSMNKEVPINSIKNIFSDLSNAIQNKYQEVSNSSLSNQYKDVQNGDLNTYQDVSCSNPDKYQDQQTNYSLIKPIHFTINQNQIQTNPLPSNQQNSAQILPSAIQFQNPYIQSQGWNTLERERERINVHQNQVSEESHSIQSQRAASNFINKLDSETDLSVSKKQIASSKSNNNNSSCTVMGYQSQSTKISPIVQEFNLNQNSEDMFIEEDHQTQLRSKKITEKQMNIQQILTNKRKIRRKKGIEEDSNKQVKQKQQKAKREFDTRNVIKNAFGMIMRYLTSIQIPVNKDWPTVQADFNKYIQTFTRGNKNIQQSRSLLQNYQLVDSLEKITDETQRSDLKQRIQLPHPKLSLIEQIERINYFNSLIRRHSLKFLTFNFPQIISNNQSFTQKECLNRFSQTLCTYLQNPQSFVRIQQ